MINGKVVLRTRLKAEVSLTELARKTGLTAQQLNDIEQGHSVDHSTITLEKVRRLADVLGITLQDLFIPPQPRAAAPAPEFRDRQGETPDACALAALLVTVPAFRPSDIAAALPGWDNERTRAAINALDDAFAAVGLALDEAEDGMRTLKATANQSHTPTDLNEVMVVIRGGTPSTMAMAFEMIVGPVPTVRATYSDLKDRAWLEEAGITRYDPKLQAIGLTQEAAHGLLRPHAGWPQFTRPGQS